METEIDFKALSVKYPEIQHYLTGNKSGSFPFKDHNAKRALTKVILAHYYNLNVNLPEKNLCPMVPNRLNYIKWVHELLDEFIGDNADIYGVDIGTGASCVYPLLGTSLYKSWKFIATDIDAESIQVATENVLQNSLSDRIAIVHNDDENTIFPFNQHEFPREIAFTMCNPPFYSSVQEKVDLNASKQHTKSVLATSTHSESVTLGGEKNFVQRMVNESALYADRVMWFTTMVGRKETLAFLTKLLAESKVKRVAKGILKQGKTVRWTVGWTFKDLFPRMALTRRDVTMNSIEEACSALLRLFTDLGVKTSQITNGQGSSELYTRIGGFMTRKLGTDSLSLDSSVNNNGSSEPHSKVAHDGLEAGDPLVFKYECSGLYDTWSRRARRKLASLDNREKKRIRFTHDLSNGAQLEAHNNGRSSSGRDVGVGNDAGTFLLDFILVVQTHQVSGNPVGSTDPTKIRFWLCSETTDLRHQNKDPNSASKLLESLANHIVSTLSAIAK